MNMARKFYNVRLGMQPIAWVNDDMHDIGDHIGFEQIIREMKEAGFEGTELGRKYPRESKILKKSLKEEDLVLTSGWCDINFINPAAADETIKRFKKHTDFLKEMGCQQVIVCEIGQSTDWDPIEDRSALGVIKMNDAQWRLLADGLNACGKYARDLNMELVYHVHNGTVIETLEETIKLCAMTDKDSVFMLMDTGHLHYNGVDIVKFVQTVGSRIRYVHLKDIRDDVFNMVKKFKLDFNSAVRVGIFTMPGDGDIAYEPIFDALEETGYQGWMVVEAEQNPRYADPLQYAKNCRLFLRQKLGQ
jgi:inosose dehydratase